MGLKGLFKTNVITISPDRPVTEAAQLMRDYKIGNVVVVRDENARKIPVGMITDRDIAIKCVAEGCENLHNLTVEDVMSPDLVHAKESDGVYKVAQKMRTEGVARLPVVSDDGALVGVITSMNLLALFSDELSEIIDISDAHRDTAGRFGATKGTKTKSSMQTDPSLFI